MKEIGLFIFPWDLADEGIDRVMGFAANSGITTLYMASVYHAGLFLHPHNPVRKVYLLEDGVAYFHPRFQAYGKIRPVLAQVSQERDWFAEVASRSREFGLRLSAWTVCMHNSRLGAEHPYAVIYDAFSNPHSYALCPSHPDVQRYVRALIKDLSRYPLCSLLLEAFRYMDVVHGAHHERWSIPLPPLERELLSMSFAPSDLAAAERVGVDGERLRDLVRGHLERFFASYPRISSQAPKTLQEFETRFPEIAAYRRTLASVVDGLLDRVLEDLDGCGMELVGQGPQEFNIGCSPGKSGIDALLCSVYDQGPVQAGKLIGAAKRIAIPGQRVYAAVKLGFGAITEASQLADIVSAMKDAAADAVLFYNYGECPQTVLNWILPAVKSWN
jgi:hypothetical protein